MIEQTTRATSSRKRNFFSLLPFAVCLLIFLTGCVNYDVGVNFKHQHRGTFVQHIKIADRLTNLSQAEVARWFKSIEERTAKLKGKIKKISTREVLVTIPFSNTGELASAFNNFFNPGSNSKAPLSSVDAAEIPLSSKISLSQSNLLLAQRDRLSLSVDLRALNFFANQDKLIVNPDSLVELEFNLNTPWGARSVKKSNSLTPKILNDGHQLVWQLQPGQINYIEAVFWLPSPLGVGTLIIVALMFAGFFFKYKRFPWNEETIQSI